MPLLRRNCNGSPGTTPASRNICAKTASPLILACRGVINHAPTNSEAPARITWVMQYAPLNPL